MSDRPARQRETIDMNEHEDIIAKDAINPANIDVTFEDVGGTASPYIITRKPTHPPDHPAKHARAHTHAQPTYNTHAHHMQTRARAWCTQGWRRRSSGCGRS